MRINTTEENGIKGINGLIELTQKCLNCGKTKGEHFKGTQTGLFYCRNKEGFPLKNHKFITDKPKYKLIQEDILKEVFK